MEELSIGLKRRLEAAKNLALMVRKVNGSEQGINNKILPHRGKTMGLCVSFEPFLVTSMNSGTREPGFEF